ncbi:hypothetical protein P3W45_000700 [Vairimorpha bombi]|jgi:hypothetical protein
MHEYNIYLFINNPPYLHEYYKSIKSKLKCDTSLYNIEVEICTLLYSEYFKVCTPDYLLNTKISLYKDRILPVYLNIQESNIVCNKLNIQESNIVCNNLDFLNYKIPSDFISEYLQYIEYCTSISKDHDTLLSIIIYSLIKSGVKDIKKKILFISTYRRRIFIQCEHRIKRNEEEISYYIRILEIAVVFIERMEYKDLNISKEEYDSLILR